ncbi:transmembrane protein 132E isoform X2 [Hermetia illucens]|uniref:transmembrane protein 132E isoform X2 n=1 Tax=Hermetia illucens TaxID=343691 RepID=UPI0018CC132F|nr:transmembrane protein 132E isoform X2 [Hermetia illucens]
MKSKKADRARCGSKPNMDLWILCLAVASLFGLTHSVEVHFETPDSGFFLKHSPRQPVSPEIGSSSSSQSKSKMAQDSVLSVDRFTVVQTTQPVSIRASYGPFSTKQTVPARYIVPDAMETQGDTMNNTTAALMELQQSNLHLDISAHLVRPTVPRDSPVLRVLFHAGADPGGHLQRQKICVLLHVSMGTRQPLKGRCMPEGEDGVCVAEVIIPSNWWPPLPPPEKDNQGVPPPKVPPRQVQVSYSVFEPPARNPEQCEPKVQIQPLTSFAQVPLVAAQSTYKELRADESLTILVPNLPLYPMSKIHVPVFLQQQQGDQNIAVFIVRARVKAGMKILGASASSDQWNISIEKENPKHTVARVTAFRKDQDPDSAAAASTKQGEATDSNKLVEVFSWLLEVANDTKENWDGGKIIWSVSYVFDAPKLKDSSPETTGSTPEETRKKIIAKLEINKDDIQAVLPIAKNWELMNTAVLTGRQVSQAMKVFIVSQAGKVADVTLQSSCHAEDESVIKVSSSCSSVYVDGSEIRGSSNASIIVKYGSYVGVAKFIVWMPEFPLEVFVADSRLSQIKGWKIPDEHHFNPHGKINRRRRKRWTHHTDDFMNNLGAEKTICRARYQQSPVEVYAKFLAKDQDSGRISHLISRRTGLQVTDLVQSLLRVADPKIATLNKGIVQGRSMGRTEVQVLSPITGRVIGAKEIRVGSDKVSLNRLIVRVVSGLQLQITPDSGIENGYVAETSVTRRLTAQYQEGLLDIDLEFSDRTRTPLRDVSVDDYFLLVESLDTEVVAFAPMLASHHPRVIAVGEGNGDLLRVNLLLSEQCRLRRSLPLSKSKPNPGLLASALASVQVDFSSADNAHKPDTVQNDGIAGRERKGPRDSGDLSDIIGIPLKDDSNHEPTVQARQHRGGLSPLDGIRHKSLPHGDMTSMEIGMYVLLTAFCFAIIVFVISCVVYASKFRPISPELGLENGNKDSFTTNGILREPRRPRESTTNAHDWVWLGRSTLDRSSMIQDTENGNILENQRDSRIRITSNPMNLNYADPDDALIPVTSFDNGNRMPGPYVNTNGIVDSSTYSKTDRRTIVNDNDVPPPIPPHGRQSTNGNEGEYRPPVPPHRNVGVTANVNPNTEKDVHNVPRRHHKHHRNSNHINHRRSQVHGSVDLIRSYDRPTDQHLNLTQQQLNLAFFNQNSPEQTFSPHEISPVQSERESETIAMNSNDPDANELHMAERLVESAAQQQKNAFQFDSLTPKREPLSVTNNNNNHNNDKQSQQQEDIQLNASKPGDESKEVKRRHKRHIPATQNATVNSSSDDNGGFITPPGEDKISRKHQVKRATVVGNPMFSSTADGDIGPGESLGLDDLDMDYEQIMHYFDNLKESNA